MSSVQWAITVTPELARAIDALATERGDSRSGLIELLLREHGMVQDAVVRHRLPTPRAVREAAGHKHRIAAGKAPF